MVIRLPKKIIFHKDHAILNLGFRFLIYPLSTSFIKNLDPRYSEKWVRAGWGIDNTVLLELTHMTIPPSGFPDRSPASSLFSGVIHAWKTNKYYRFVAFTKGYFQSIDQLNLKIDCWHEQRHMRRAEEYMYDGTPPPTEEEIAEEEVKHVYETFGEDGIRTRGNHITALIGKNKDADAIPGYVAVMWLREFFEYKVSHYRSKSLAIPQNQYTSRMKEMNGKMTSIVTNVYQKILHIDPLTIFRYSTNR